MTVTRMHIEFSTDNTVAGNEELAAHVKSVVEQTLGRFSDRISRVEVHLSDLNGQKGGHDDKRCMMEVRLDGRQPSAVTDEADTFDRAISGAAGKLKRSVESTLGSESSAHGLRDHR